MGEYVWGRYDILVLPPTFPYVKSLLNPIWLRSDQRFIMNLTKIFSNLKFWWHGKSLLNFRHSNDHSRRSVISVGHSARDHTLVDRKFSNFNLNFDRYYSLCFFLDLWQIYMNFKVTNCSWEHFWLNEGFTRFIERKLIALQFKSEKQRQFECIEGWRELIQAVRHL